MDDPSVNYIFNTEVDDNSEEKRKLIEFFFTIFLGIHRFLKEGAVVIRNTNPVHAVGRCIHFWLKPGFDIFRQPFQSGIFNFLKLGFFSVLRCLEFTYKGKVIEDRYLDGIHDQTFILSIAATHSNFQKQGLMKNCMNPLLKAIDEVNGYCWLECPKEQNVALYEHYGFKIVETYELSWFNYFSGKPNVKIWSMLRYPKKKDL